NGTFHFKVNDYVALIDQVAGVRNSYLVKDVKIRITTILDQLLMKWITREGKNLFNLQANAFEISEGIKEDLDMQIVDLGMTITAFNINSFTYPKEIQDMVIKTASHGMIGDVQKYQQVSMTDGMATGKVKGSGVASDMTGMMMGMNVANEMMKNMNQNQSEQPNQTQASQNNAPSMKNSDNKQNAPNSCPNCAEKTVGGNFCSNCGQKLVYNILQDMMDIAWRKSFDKPFDSETHLKSEGLLFYCINQPDDWSFVWSRSIRLF